MLERNREIKILALLNKEVLITEGWWWRGGGGLAAGIKAVKWKEKATESGR